MTHGLTYIASKGSCIYCLRSGLKLTNEHIFPYFMGGVHVIRDASCRDCAKITSRFELDVARELWGDARTSYDFPSRRKSKRPKYIQQPDQYNPGLAISIPVEEYPAPMVFYQMQKAGILQGLPEIVDLSRQWTLTSIVDNNKINNFIKKYGQSPAASFRHVPDSFARLLAKIAYGQVLCSLDPNDFDAICLPYILGEKSNLSYIVGGCGNLPEPQPDIGYELKSHCIRSAGRLLIISEIQFLSNCRTPKYHVVVGYVEGEVETTRVFEKIEATYSVDISDTELYKMRTEDAFHWMPFQWPLPAWKNTE
ncbi:hypothetical protein [Pseudomonas migulae]